MPVGARPVRLDARHDADREVRFARERTHRGGHRSRSDSRHIAQQAAPVEAPRAEPLGDRQHHLPVRHRCFQQRLLQPERPEGQPLGVAARTEVARLAREGDEILVPAAGGLAPHPREPLGEDAAREELLRHLADHGAPVAVRGGEAVLIAGVERREVVLEQPEQRRVRCAAGLVDASRGGGRGRASRERRVASTIALGAAGTITTRLRSVPRDCRPSSRVSPPIGASGFTQLSRRNLAKSASVEQSSQWCSSASAAINMPCVTSPPVWNGQPLRRRRAESGPTFHVRDPGPVREAVRAGRSARGGRLSASTDHLVVAPSTQLFMVSLDLRRRFSWRMRGRREVPFETMVRQTEVDL